MTTQPAPQKISERIFYTEEKDKSIREATRNERNRITFSKGGREKQVL